ncbi:MAG: hypothetical protein NTX76_04305 [Alphaproteobacteria bacterium]|nr:hypothetical protein [Alphaproteobacteria bacterium]
MLIQSLSLDENIIYLGYIPLPDHFPHTSSRDLIAGSTWAPWSSHGVTGGLFGGKLSELNIPEFLG